MSDTVDNVSQAFLKQRTDMQLCHDLMGGTEAMLAAGRRYIPQEDGESDKEWQIRLERTILFNVFKRTLRYLAGRVFEKQVVLDGDEIDQRFTDFCENVDRMGRNLTVWGRKAFELGLQDGVVFCLTDYSAIRTRKAENGVIQYQQKNGGWANRTEAANRDNGWRPYFILVEAGSVLDARLEWQNGIPRICHFRYVENVEEPDGKWGTQTYQRIRAFYLDENGKPVWEVWSNRTEAGGTGAFDFVEAGSLSLDHIPATVFMPGERRTGLTAQPALDDLAQLNKRHWQATCGQFELMEYVRRPPWFGKNLGEIDAQSGRTHVIFGAGKLCLAQSPDASLQSIGIDSTSVEAGRQELKDLETRMAVYGLQLLQPKTGVITATESARDAEESNSTLKAWALQFQDFLENCMVQVANWYGLPDGPGVVVNTNFGAGIDISLLLDFYRAGAISRQTMLELARNEGLLPDELDIEGEAELIEREIKGGEGPTGIASAAQNLFDMAGAVS